MINQPENHARVEKSDQAAVTSDSLAPPRDIPKRERYLANMLRSSIAHT